MEKDFVKENQKILEAWEQEYKNRGNDINFVPDGIMFRGDFAQCDNGIWYRKKSGKENQLWSECPLRILYMTKDQNAGEDHNDFWDCRGGSLHKPNTNIEDNVLFKVKSGFNQNIANSLYGLVTTTPQKMIEFEDVDEKDAVKICDEYPFAHINCKKEAGGPQCPNSVLDKAMDEYQSFLKGQIQNLDADIIVCSGGWRSNTDVMVNFLNNAGYNFEQKTYEESYVSHYDAINNKLAISAYHLGYGRYSRKSMYNDIVKTYYLFLQEHPDFIKSHRK